MPVPPWENREHYAPHALHTVGEQGALCAA